MISVTVEKVRPDHNGTQTAGPGNSRTGKYGQYRSFSCVGHAGFDEEGRDIVCAAVSALVVTAGNSLDALTEDSVRIEDRDGYVRFRFPDPHSEHAGLLMDALMLGLAEICEAYGERFLSIRIREV